MSLTADDDQSLVPQAKTSNFIFFPSLFPTREKKKPRRLSLAGSQSRGPRFHLALNSARFYYQRTNADSLSLLRRFAAAALLAGRPPFVLVRLNFV